MVQSFLPFLTYTGIVGAASAFVYNDVELLAKAQNLEIQYLAVAAVAIALIGFFLLPSFVDEGRVGGSTGILNNKDQLLTKNNVHDAVEVYENMFGTDSRSGAADHEKLLDKRKTGYTTMVNNFYDLVTDFYEYGWGPCFHFGQRFIGESFMESIRRTEYKLALALGLDSTKKAADIGCGVGGPLRNMVRFSGAHITGVNNNEYQVKLGNRYSVVEGLESKCSYLKCDFMNIPVEDGTFDAAYAIEATCHAPDKVGCYSEVFRILKPGGRFAGYEWCVTPKYDASNPRHKAIKAGIEQGNSLPELATYEEVVDALRKSGFEVIESYNLQDNAHSKHEVPWYDTLSGQYTLSGFRMTRMGRFITHVFVSTLEFLRIAPKGASRVSAFLNATADDLVDGGKLEIFTPSFFFVAQKPLDGAKPRRKSISNKKL